MKYRAFLEKGDNNGIMITGGSGWFSLILLFRWGLWWVGSNPNSVEDFNPLWISEFKSTNAYDVWDRITDPLLFDLVEPR